MKNIKFTYLKTLGLLGLLFALTISCEREASEDVVFATFSKTGEVFTDAPIGLGTDFYFPFSGSKPTAWTVDNTEGYESEASMRIDVPNANDPEGSYAGAIFRVDGAGRNLTEFDALTFWAKASQGVTIGEIGFGQDFGENRYQVSTSISVGTIWAKYTIPIPDPSKLIEERGMLWYAASGLGDVQGQETGYTFWLDEVKFEKLGTLGQPRPAILNGLDDAVQNFVDLPNILDGFTQTFNLASGLNQTTNIAPSYFDFQSSNPGVATVNELGVVTNHAIGSAVITASLNGVEAAGSLALEVIPGSFDFAPIPTRNPSDVISIFSDVYTNVPVDFFNGYWEPFQTTLSEDLLIDGDNILNYTNFNFVGNQFTNPTVDATSFANVHIDMYIPNSVPTNIDFLITLVDFGADQVDGGGDDTREQIFFDKALFVANTWITLEFPITMTNKNNMGLIIYENINGSSLSNFYLDNIYFYK